jgi:hypothetical protein
MRILAALAAAAGCACFAGVSSARADVIVRFAHGTSAAEKKAVLAEAGLRTEDSIAVLDAVVATTTVPGVQAQAKPGGEFAAVPGATRWTLPVKAAWRGDQVRLKVTVYDGSSTKVGFSRPLTIAG